MLYALFMPKSNIIAKRIAFHPQSLSTEIKKPVGCKLFPGQLTSLVPDPWQKATKIVGDRQVMSKTPHKGNYWLFR
jgi:hypothetical protein